MGGWADAPKDILELIFQRMGNDLMDKLNFGVVCRNWRSLAAEKGFHIRPRIMLVDFNTNENRLYNKNRQMFTLSSTNDVYNIHQNVPANNKCYGSFDGFLITFDRNLGQIHLLNPILGTKFLLPTPLVVPSFCSAFSCIVITSLIANAGYVILFQYGSACLHLCRLGSEGWATLILHSTGLHDVICYKDKWYAMMGKKIEVFGLGTSGFEKYIINLGEEPGFPPNNTRRLQEGPHTTVKQLLVPKDFDGVGNFERVYLINTPDDELLMVLRYGKCRFFSLYDTVGFKVFRQVEGGEGWEAVESLGQHVFFIGEHPLCLTADNALKCQENSIYFAHSYGWLDSGIFSMKSGRIQPIYKECPLESSRKIWFIPNIHPNFQLPI